MRGERAQWLDMGVGSERFAVLFLFWFDPKTESKGLVLNGSEGISQKAIYIDRSVGYAEKVSSNGNQQISL